MLAPHLLHRLLRTSARAATIRAARPDVEKLTLIVAAAWSSFIILALAACGSSPGHAGETRQEAAQSMPPATYETIGSTDGVLATTLTAANSPITIAGKTFSSMVYNGRYLPPVLRIRPGDSLKLHLVNRIRESDQMTNLHYHGTSVSPKAPSDDVFLHVLPSQSYDYRLYFAPDHDRGLFWYHPHAHGKSEDQVLGGMSGALVVEGFLEQFYPWLANVEEKILMLKALEMPGHKDGQPQTKNINGQLDATFRIRPGEIQFWRVANLAADAYFNLRIDGHRVWLLANDANALRRPTIVDSLFLPPGARAEVLVQGGAPGRYAIQHRLVNTGPAGDPNPVVTLGALISEGSPVDRSADVRRLSQLADNPSVVSEIESLRTSRITRRRTFVFSETADGNTFFVNGKQFDPNRVDTQVDVGDVEEWTIRNTTGEFHAFHIHQTDFLVTEINGVPQGGQSLHDTVNLPYAMNGRPGVVKIIIPFPDERIAGKFVYHCHILEHEDGGMMGVIQVNSRASKPTNTASASAHHGSRAGSPPKR
jgi:suppressor of ftsI